MANNNCGGILGGVNGGTVTIKNCYNRGNISGYSTIGGIIGVNQSKYAAAKLTMENCYSTGIIKASVNPGALLGLNTGQLNPFVKCYYLKGIGGINKNGAIGKEESELKILEETDLGEQFMIVDGMNDGYPILKYQYNKEI